MGFEENEVSNNAFGGTEIAKRSLGDRIKPELLESSQIICSRVRDLDPTKVRVYWLHDLPEDPESAKLRLKSHQDKFHHLVFISNWQYARYQHVLGLHQSHKHSIIETGIIPAPAVEKSTDKIRLVYTSTPQRGLEILLPVFIELAKKYENIHLDVFSSFKIYGWHDYDKQFEPLYDICRTHPQITYHGFVPNEQLKEYLNASHIFSYPCIWPETSCRAMLEAMSARLLCVHPNYAALPETSGGLNLMYQSDADKNTHAAQFYMALDVAIQKVQDDYANLQPRLNLVKLFADTRFNITNVSRQWELLLGGLQEQYPTVESRALPISAHTFTYTSH